MHEYSLVQALVSRVGQEADAHEGAVVKKLFVRIGELAGVEEDLFTTAFEMFRDHTVCASAELVVKREAVEWQCPGCEETIPSGVALRCSSCALPARLVKGGELYLDRIELEVPDV